MFLFLLNCGGRTQDCFGVETKEFSKALENNQPYLLSAKKTNVAHWVLMDDRIHAYIKEFVDSQSQANAKYVWGPRSH